MKRTRTPREKKLLCYAKDGRNTVAESRSKAHRAITKRKAKANRSFRHAESLALREALENDDVFVARISRRSWKKSPDAPLGEYVAARLGRRADDGMNAVERTSGLLKAGRKRAKVRSFGLYGWLQRREPLLPVDDDAPADG